ncbi:hypothetical protein [Antrihabitans stalactiti]|uniref:Uncharacterized protein n=1 Tax=Antrihabitans stalactiti TaxID=2584121 RepID=A0A848K8G6_9NOCA|nr:hypothetical protein [Antrihabitans stalactiti]NMN95103.1 hypothetical protein [Antrihabitans stalactiti]
MANQPLPQRQPWWYYAIGVVLLVLVIVSAICGFAIDGTRGKVSQGLNPVLGTLFGLWAADLYYRRDANKKLHRDVKSAAYTINVMIQRVFDINQYVAQSANRLNEGNQQRALQELYGAIASIQGTMSQGYQALRQWRDLSDAAAQEAEAAYDEDRARIGQRQQIQRGGSNNSGGGSNGNA